ncbi:MAG: hypothetical protein AAB875_07315, partial [Patescibacteria group bacterium]
RRWLPVVKVGKVADADALFLIMVNRQAKVKNPVAPENIQTNLLLAAARWERDNSLTYCFM